MEITVNGETRRIDASTTVAALLRELGLGERPVAVERNREIVARADREHVVLEAGDSLEIVSFVGGG